MLHSKRRVGIAALKSEFSFVYIYLAAGIMLLMAVFLFVRPASAQVEQEQVDTVAIEPVTPVVEVQASEDDGDVDTSESADVLQDEQVTSEDFGLRESRILPNSRWYGLKRLGRTLREAITVNPVKKVELRLQHANQELIDAQRVLEQSTGDTQAADAALDGVRRFEEKVQAIQEHVAELQERKQQGDERVGRLLDNVLDKQIKQHKVLQRLEEKVSERAPAAVSEKFFERLEEARDATGQVVGDVLVQVEQDPDQLAERFDRVLEGQRGSEFKHLRNIEILEKLGERVPEQARQAIEQAQAHALQRFANTVKDLPEEGRTDRLEMYVRHVGGDELNHIQVFDHLKQVGDLPPDVLQRMEQAKDIFANRFQQRLEGIDAQFEDGAVRQQARERVLKQFEQLQGEDVEKLRAVEEVRRRVQFDNPELQQEVEARHKQAIEKFQQTFADPESAEQAEKFRELSRKMVENPDPTTFRLLEELEERVKSDPKKREFVERMEQDVKAQFAERAQKMQDKFLEQITSSNPEDIEIYKKLQQDFLQHPRDFEPRLGEDGTTLPSGQDQNNFGPPPELFRFLDTAIEKQTEFLKEHREEINNPEALRRFESRFENVPPAVLKEIRHQQDGLAEEFGPARPPQFFPEERSFERPVSLPLNRPEQADPVQLDQQPHRLDVQPQFRQQIDERTREFIEEKLGETFQPRPRLDDQRFEHREPLEQGQRFEPTDRKPEFINRPSTEEQPVHINNRDEKVGPGQPPEPRGPEFGQQHPEFEPRSAPQPRPEDGRIPAPGEAPTEAHNQ